MKNSNKKGFTLVELVIVIAVVAILAAVLIPTFASLVKRANLSADEQAVRQINTLLATEFVTDKPESLKEVVDMLDENGYDVDALEPLTEGYKFAWDKENNKIILVAESNVGSYETLDSGVSFINKEVSSVAELQQAILNGSDVKLTTDITTNKLNIPSGANITIDLNGYVLYAATTTQTDADGSSKSEYAVENNGGTVVIENGTIKSRGLMNRSGNMTIKNATVIATDAGGGMAVNVKGGKVVIENSTLVAASGNKAFNENTKDTTDVYYEPQCLFVTNGSVVANNTTFECKESGAYAIAGGDNSTIELNSCTVEAYRGGVHAETSSTITINGGTYKQLHAEATGHLFYAKGTIVVSNANCTAAKSLQCTEESGVITIK